MMSPKKPPTPTFFGNRRRFHTDMHLDMNPVFDAYYWEPQNRWLLQCKDFELNDRGKKRYDVFYFYEVRGDTTVVILRKDLYNLKLVTNEMEILGYASV
jgi:hypothetical protein